MDEKFRRWLPERVIYDYLKDWLPEPWFSILVWILVVATWASLISFFVQLSVVIDAAAWLYNNAGYLAPILLFIGRGIHAVVAAWHTLTEPLRLALVAYLPFNLPRIAFDALIVACAFIGTYVKAWLATREERRVMAIFTGVKVPLFRISNFSPEGVLSLEGKWALLSRMIAALDILDTHYSSYIHDKAEDELVAALDEMTQGISEKDFRVLEEAFSLPRDEMIEFLRGCAWADRVAAWHSRRIVRSGLITCCAMSVALLGDLAYRHLA